MDPKQKLTPKQEMLMAFGKYGSLGFQVAVSTVLGGFLGRFLDEKLDTEPWFLVGGILLFFMAGLWPAYRMLMQDTKNSEFQRLQTSSSSHHSSRRSDSDRGEPNP